MAQLSTNAILFKHKIYRAVLTRVKTVQAVPKEGKELYFRNFNFKSQSEQRFYRS